MNDHTRNNGPSKRKVRRIQIGVFALTLAILLIQAWVPLLNPEKRAERLYNGSWFAGLEYMEPLIAWIDERGHRKQQKIAAAMLEKSLELSPGNLLYEQALAWSCPESGLPKLLAEGNLGAKAAMLAHYRYYVYAANDAKNRASSAASKRAERATEADSAKSIYAYPKGYWHDSLARSDRLIVADPGNAQAYYIRALIYGDMEQPSRMIALVRKANAMPSFVDSIPDMSAALSGSIVSYELYGLADGYAYGLERCMIDYGNALLRNGKVDEAVTILEDCCRMGIRFSRQKPASSRTYLMGASIFDRGWRELEPVYRDFGYTRQLQQHRRVEASLHYGRVLIGKADRDYLIVSPTMHMTIGYFGDLLVTMGLIAAFAVLWLVAALVSKRRGIAAFHVPSWGEGWLLWRFLAMYMSALVLLLLAARAFPGLVIPAYFFLAMEWVGYDYYMPVIVLVALFQLIILWVVVSQLRRRYSEHTGTRIGTFRFVFRVPVEVRAWACRSITLMFAGQMLFLLCLVMIGAIYLKASLGFYPWQPERMKVFNTEQEYSAVLKAVQGLEERSSTIRITE